MRRVAILLCVAVLLAPGVTALSAVGLVPASSSAEELIVGYREGALREVVGLVNGLGGSVLRTNEDLRIVVVDSRGIVGSLASVLLAKGVEFAETNDVTRLNGAQWNGAQWNGAQWNGAQWNWNDTNADGEDIGVDSQWGLQKIDAAAAWRASRGERVAKLCVLDSGLAWDHRDIQPNVWTASDGSHGYNAIDPKSSAYDDAGHGTHVAGIAAAANDNAYGVAGVGNVRIMAVKVLDANGEGKEDDLAFGITWCANQGASVALMALGVDKDGPTLRRAISYAAERDVLLVASAGNKGCEDCVNYPARDPHVIAVAALDKNGSRASFSSRGPQVELAAPGVDILGPLPGGKFASGSGTSQAAAFVAGVAALARDADPGLTAAQTRAKLSAAADDLGSATSFGKGALDAGAALEG